VFIAFEGPDKTGKTSSAVNLSNDGSHNYNVDKAMHTFMQKDIEGQPELVVTYDRIDWFTHMVYRLALPEHEWNDPRVRTVFAMPDTHLVIKVHDRKLAASIDDELYSSGTLETVNDMYLTQADAWVAINVARGFSLFKSISLVEVINHPRSGVFRQSLLAFSSPSFSNRELAGSVHDDKSLLELLRYEDQRRL
jgi:hypothetical protein